MSVFNGTFFKSHEENRTKLCGPCGKKIKLGNIKPERFRINEKMCGLIKKFINPEYCIHDSKYPVSICHTCSNTLREFDKGSQKRPLPTKINYCDINLRKNTRLNISEFCTCYICSTARSTTHNMLQLGRGKKRQFKNEIKTSKNENVEESPDASRFDVNKNKDHKNIVLCSNCLQEFGRGKNHRCHDKLLTNSSVSNIIHSLPKNQQEQVISHVIRDLKLADMEDNTSFTLRNERGKPTVLFTKQVTETKKFTEKDLDNFAVNTNSSVRTMRKLANFIRSTVGRNAVPKGYANHFTQKQRELENVYKSDILLFDTSTSKEKELRPVVWADATELVEAVIDARGIIGYYTAKLMADGGQNFFKLCLTILPDDYFEEENSEDPPLKKRKTYSEGGSIGEKAKLTSVKRTIMLCIVPDIKETYENVKILFELTAVNKISFKFVSDFKLMLLVNGMQTATATYPCPYCSITLNDLRQFKDPRSAFDENENYALKNYGDLRSDYQKFVSLKMDKKNASQCHSVVNSPLFDEDDKVCVIEKCIIPELHIMLGYTNHLFWDGLVPLLGEEKALLWPQKLNLVVKNYHGRQFEGNACRELLKSADKLNDPEIYEKVGFFKVLPFINAFKEMNKIVHASFSTCKVTEDMPRAIENLYKNFLATEVSKTLKIHVLVDHLTECLSFLAGEGLGKWSEQPGESIHYEFLIHWNRRKVNSLKDPSYIQKLKDAVISFSSLHI